NSRLILRAVRAGISERKSLWSIYESMTKGLKLGWISRKNMDMLSLSCLLAKSEIEGPRDFLFDINHQRITKEAQDLAKIAGIPERLSILKAQLVVDCDLKPYL